MSKILTQINCTGKLYVKRLYVKSHMDKVVRKPNSNCSEAVTKHHRARPHVHTHSDLADAKQHVKKRCDPKHAR